MHHGADLRALEDMAEVAGQSIRDIDRRMRQAAEPFAERDARLGLVQPLRRFPDLRVNQGERRAAQLARNPDIVARSEEHTSELQSLAYLVCRLLLEKKK